MARRISTTSDSDGHFRLDGLYAGPVFVFAQKADYRLNATFAKSGAGGLTIRLLPSDQPAPLRPTPPRAPRESQLRLAHKILDYVWSTGNQWEKRDAVWTMALVDPVQAKKWSAEDGGKYDDTIREATATQLAETDVDKALAALPADPQRAFTTLFSLATQYAGADRPKALRFAEEAASRARRPGTTAQELASVGDLLFRLGKQEEGRQLIEEAVRRAEKLPTKTAGTAANRADALGSVARNVALYDAPRAMALLDSIPADRRWFRVNEVAVAVARSDPSRGLAMLTAPRGGSYPYYLRLQIAAHLAATRPAEGIRIVEDLQPGQGTNAPPWQAIDADAKKIGGFGVLAVAIAPRDKKPACSLVDRGLALCQETPEFSLPSSFRADPAARLLFAAGRIAYPDLESAVTRALAAGRAIGSDRFPSLGQRVATRSIRSDVTLAWPLTTIDPATARELLEIVDARSPSIETSMDSAREWFEAWALLDAGHAGELFERLTRGTRETPQDTRKSNFLEAARLLALPPDQRFRRIYSPADVP